MNAAIESYCNSITIVEKKAIVYPNKVGMITNIITGKSALDLEDIDDELFVKLHNLSFAVEKLYEMYELMNVKKINETMLNHMETVNESKIEDPATNSKIKGQFKIEVILAENLKPTNKSGSSDPFAVMRVPEGTRIPPLEKVQRADNQTLKEKSINNAEEEIILKGNECELFR